MLRSQGAVLKDVSLPNLPLSVPTYYVVAPAECSSNLARFDGVRYGYRCDNPRDLLDLYQRSRGEGFGAEVKRRIMTGTYVLSAGYYDAFYLKAQRVRQLISDDFERAFHEVDVVIGPTTPTTAFELGAKTADPVTMYLNDIYTIGANLAGLPAISVPCGLAQGLPVGDADHRPAFRRGAAAERRASLPARERLAPARAAGVRLMEWETVIGLEIHAQLATRSKIFSGSATAYGAPPNAQANLIDLAYPGVLPVLNAEAVRMAVKFGLAINARVTRRSIFARKNYFYPDLPKGYQISQYELPIVSGGAVDIVLEDGSVKRIGVTRAHLEEDAGKSLHEGLAGLTGVDLNRAGTPLIEIVSEPHMRSAKEAVAYLKKIHTLVRYLDICDGNMQEGSFRCDANVSVRPRGTEKLGTRAEIKNLNSFRFVEKAINYEVARQIELLEGGGQVVQETRLYDADRGETRSMRSQGRGQRLSLLPRSGPAAGGDRSALHRYRVRQPAGAARPEGAALHRATTACRPTTPACSPPAPSWPTTTSVVVRRAGSRHRISPKLAANTVMGELAGLLNRDGLEISDSRVDAGGSGGAAGARGRQHHLRQDRQGRARGDVGRRHGRRCDHRGARPAPDHR